MNGSKSTFKRKGYWLTALATAVLLAASSGTALAQDMVTINSVTLSPSTVAEGGEATATLKFTATADSADGVAATATIRFAFSASGSNGAEGGDFTGLTTLAAPISTGETLPVPIIRDGTSRSFTVTHTFRVNHDLDAEDEEFRLDAQVTGWESVTGSWAEADGDRYKIEDDETQTYTLSLEPDSDGELTEGDDEATKVTLTADPKRTAVDTVPDFTLVTEPGRGYAFVMFDGDDAPTAVEATWQMAIAAALGNPDGSEGSRVTKDIGTIATAGVDSNRVDDILTLKLYSGTVGDSTLVTELSIAVNDIHQLAAPSAITAVAKDAVVNGETVTQIVEGGDPVYLTVTVDRGTGRTVTTGEELTVDLRAGAAQVGDFTVEPSRITLPDKSSGKSNSDVDIVLTALNDEDVGTEDLVLHLVVSGKSDLGSGTSTGTFSIPIVDETTKKVSPKSEADAYPAILDAIKAAAGEDGLNPGESFMVMTDDLFDVTDGYTASYKASVDGEAVSISASAERLTVEAKLAGAAKVTVTATAGMAGSSFLPEQTDSDVAHITFEVTVVDTPLSVMVTADPMEIEEGGTSMIIATASRAIEAGDGAVEIDLIVVGDATLAADSITIAAGDMSGYTMLTATADDDMDDETVVVVASGSGITTSMQVDVAVTDTTEPVEPEPVPALPLIGQLLLGLGLLGGGARHLYRRRRQG